MSGVGVSEPTRRVPSASARGAAGRAEPLELENLRADEEHVGVGERVRPVDEHPRAIARAQIAHEQRALANDETRVDRREILIVLERKIAGATPDGDLRADPSPTVRFTSPCSSSTEICVVDLGSLCREGKRLRATTFAALPRCFQ